MYRQAGGDGRRQGTHSLDNQGFACTSKTQPTSTYIHNAIYPRVELVRGGGGGGGGGPLVKQSNKLICQKKCTKKEQEIKHNYKIIYIKNEINKYIENLKPK